MLTERKRDREREEGERETEAERKGVINIKRLGRDSRNEPSFSIHYSGGSLTEPDEILLSVT